MYKLMTGQKIAPELEKKILGSPNYKEEDISDSDELKAAINYIFGAEGKGEMEK